MSLLRLFLTPPPPRDETKDLSLARQMLYH
jgi:hypothetical protein